MFLKPTSKNGLRRVEIWLSPLGHTALGEDWRSVSSTCFGWLTRAVTQAGSPGPSFDLCGHHMHMYKPTLRHPCVNNFFLKRMNFDSWVKPPLAVTLSASLVSLFRRFSCEMGIIAPMLSVVGQVLFHVQHKECWRVETGRVRCYSLMAIPGNVMHRSSLFWGVLWKPVSLPG